MKKLFIVTAIIESATGMMFLILPSLLVSILLGLPISSAVDFLLCRVTGAALLSIGVAFALAYNDKKSKATTGLTTAILVYNIIVSMLLAYAGLSTHLSGAGLWPAVLLHIVMVVWCIIALLKMKKVPAVPQDTIN